MAKDKQYRDDSARLAVLIEKYTNIPQDRVYQFVMENSAEMLLPHANKICRTEAQRQKLGALFEFKNLYEIVKSAQSRVYQLDSANAARDYFRSYFADVRDKEHFAVAYLDTRTQVIKTETISNGTVAQAQVYPREIIKEALFLNARAVILAHNHPSGELEASSQDIEVTVRIKRGMETMGMELFDHIIVGGDKAVSLMDMGKIPAKTKVQGMGKVAMPICENIKANRQTVKPSSIKDQLASAEKQISSEPRTNTRHNKKHDRNDR